jgi:hypothetical protein
MDKEQIKKALDHFENDEYTDAKDILKKEISSKRDEFIKNKLELKNDINPVSDEEEDTEGEDE